VPLEVVDPAGSGPLDAAAFRRSRSSAPTESRPPSGISTEGAPPQIATVIIVFLPLVLYGSLLASALARMFLHITVRLSESSATPPMTRRLP